MKDAATLSAIVSAFNSLIMFYNVILVCRESTSMLFTTDIECLPNRGRRTGNHVNGEKPINPASDELVFRLFGAGCDRYIP